MISSNVCILISADSDKPAQPLFKKHRMLFGQQLNTHRIYKRLAKPLTRLGICVGLSDALLVAHTILLEISCRGLYI